MALLTPGTLQKLLQNVGDREFKVAGEHRSALLQVISIVPSLEDDPWKTRGYFLRVSDSLHSAYVSVSGEDVDLILSNKVQLGQFIYVTRFDPGSPVPILRGIKPIPKPRPCLGHPQDLIPSDFLCAKKLDKSKGKVKNVVVKQEVGSVRRLSLGGRQVLEGVEARRLSFDSTRKVWDSTPLSKSSAKGAPKSKLKDSVVAKKKVLDFALQSRNMTVTQKNMANPVKSIKSSDDGISRSNKIPPSSKEDSEPKVLWESLPSSICLLGKDARCYKNAAFLSAVHALEEACVYESLLQAMSMFAELCKLSAKDSSGPLVEKFLNIHESIKESSITISTMISKGGIKDAKGNHICSAEPQKCASLWVQAALESNLSEFSLYENIEIEKTDPENHSSGVNKTTITSRKSVHHRGKDAKSSPDRRPSNTNGANAGLETWLPGMGLNDASALAQELLSSSRTWFLNYLEDSLKNESSQGVFLVGQFKRVHQWLNDSFQGSGGMDDRIESLKKRLYVLLLDQVDSVVSQR